MPLSLWHLRHLNFKISTFLILSAQMSPSTPTSRVNSSLLTFSSWEHFNLEAFRMSFNKQMRGFLVVQRLRIHLAMQGRRCHLLLQDWTRVSCIVGRFFTFWATRDTLFIHLQCRGYRFDPWSRKSPHAHRAAHPMVHNYWACALELTSRNSWSPCMHPGAWALQQEKPLQLEARVLQLESSPCSP